MKKLYCLILCISLFFIISGAHADDLFLTQFAGQQVVDGENSIAISFSSPLDSKQNLNAYFSILDNKEIPVEGGWILSKDLRIVYFTNIKAGIKYHIKVYKGVKNHKGIILDQARSFSVKTRSIKPMISFASKGFVLASALTRGLPVNTLNIDRAEIDFFRVKQDFLDEFCQRFGKTDYMNSYRSHDLNKYATLVYSGHWDLDIKPGIRTKANIPITHIHELKPAGVYFAVIKGAGRYEYRYSTTWFTISDIGIHARKYKNSLQLHIQSLETARPLEKVSIQAYTRHGKKTALVKTDTKGMATIMGSMNKIAYLVARKGKHISVLPMNIPALDLSEFKTATEAFRPIDLFVYGPRDIYRPGETIIIDGLLRNHDGQMTAQIPIKAKILRPDGRMAHDFTWKGKNLNFFHYEYTLPVDAITGVWRISFKHADSALKTYEFKVAEFLPERMKLAFEESEPKGNILTLSDNLTMNIKGDYLYGAPASGNKADAMIHLKPARKLFKNKWPGFEFGDATDRFGHSFKTESIFLDDKGQGEINVKNKWKNAKSPLWLTANVNLYESGGRPVVRNNSWQIWPASQLVGIRTLLKKEQAKYNSQAEFDIMVLNSEGKRIDAKDLKVRIVKEHRNYYWEYAHEAWQWRHTDQFYTIDRFTLNASKNKPARVTIPVKWGGYRLEIENPATNLTTSYRIWAGWRRQGNLDATQGSNRPDRVDIILDKPAYSHGGTVHATLKSPEGGSGYLFVEAETNLMTLPITLSPEGKTIDIKIDPGWQRHDLYISAIIIRPGESKTGNLPKRSIGLAHLPLDRNSRKLQVQITCPDKIIPGQTLEVPVQIKGHDNSVPADTWVTLAAVDTGVLNLTGFKTPSAFDYFFQPRRYSVEIHDLYQRLIETSDGAWAKQRFGGDAPKLSRGGDRPATDVQIIAMYKAAIQADDHGIARFKIDIPEFNGQVRLMAVAHTAGDFGNCEKEMTIASPLVTQIAMPRFLSMGDKSQLVLDIHNLSGQKQKLDIKLRTTSPVRLLDPKIHTLILEDKAKQHIVFPILAEQKMGRSNIKCIIHGLIIDSEKKSILRTWFIETRPPFPGITQIWNKQLKPQDSFNIETAAMAGLIKDTICVSTSLNSNPPINIAEHIQKLDAYPYGCLEQTTSCIFPHVLLSSSDLAMIGLTSQTDEQRKRKVTSGIQKLMEKQKPNGGFGLWNSQSREQYWLTAYATDFLLNARQAGYEISKTRLSKAMDRLRAYVRREASIASNNWYKHKYYSAAARSYAAMVLARVQSITLGDARSLYNSIEDDIPTQLGFVQAGIALYLAGDRSLADKALKKAVNFKKKTRHYCGDYGSKLRDAAFSYYLLSTYYPDYEHKNHFIYSLHNVLKHRRWLSTQERNTIVMAGSINLRLIDKQWQASFTSGDKTVILIKKELFQETSKNGKAATCFNVKNTGKTDIFATFTMTGYPDQKPDITSDGVQIKRRYLDFQGEPIKANDLNPGDRLIVELEFKAEERLYNGLIVDLLPACMEIEDPNLTGSTLINDVRVDNKTIMQWHKQYQIKHTEYRDDRFVAAVSMRYKKQLRIFYPARIVSPGEYLVPPPMIEDMYKPYIRGIGDAIPLMNVATP